jgi:hypothetical protein
MTKMLDLKTILIAAGSALIIGVSTGWVANGWRLNGQIDRLRADQSQALAQAGQNAMLESARLQKLKDEALNEANRILQDNAKAATAARTELDRLRRQLASTNDLSTATCPSTRDYAATLSAVFGECSTTIGELAQKADGHSLDSRTLNGAWPK